MNEIDPSVSKHWQEIVDLMAELINVPAGLIMQYKGEELEVLKSSQSESNPYEVGESAVMEGSGLYCETVIKTNNKLKVPNALDDQHWKDNPDVKLNMISYLGYPIHWPDKTPFGTICVLDNKSNNYTEGYEALVRRFRDFIEMELILLEKNAELKALNEYDSLTKSLSRQAFCSKMTDEISRTERYGHSLSLLLMDIDFFKEINDTYGHLAGDVSLIEFVKEVQSQLRPTDFIGRFGGEEFLVALPNTDQVSAKDFAERIAKVIEGKKIAYKDHVISFTISIGIAEYSETLDLDTFIGLCDGALYEAKRTGRNKVCSA